jgi:tetratricopeptide (TPR) repeat protein
MPLELSLRFTSDEKDASSSISIVLFRPDNGTMTPPAPFAPPLDDPQLADLRWYLEVFSTWPTGPDYERAEAIEAKLEDWGRDLLRSVISTVETAGLWQQFVDAKAAVKLLTIDATDPRVLRLPWELMADKSGHLFSRNIGIRRRLQIETTTEVKPFALPVRVLVLVARPEDAGFIDSRAVSEPLLDALDELGARAEVEFLYPPTLAALSARLRDRKAPPIHVVHFDGHGVYDASQGLGYLLFENDQHKRDQVDANRLGTLLNQCGVPLMVLNACQSAAQQESNPYASVAARLIRAGIGSVLAMNYSVLVVAARKFVAAFYGGLADGLTIGQSVDQGRFALLADEQRHSIQRTNPDGELVEVTTRLRDWFLPALYQQSLDPVAFEHTALPAEEPPPLSRALVDPQAPGGLPAAPLHGFHGRARELLRLERAMAEHPVVVLHGFGGQGKTTLAAAAGRWFHRTGRFPGGAAFVSFEHGGSLSQLCSWVGQAVSGDPNFALGDGDPVARIGALLRERPALMILDNFESVLGREPVMPAEELRAVLDAVWGWAAGDGVRGRRGEGVRGSRVLVTTRDTAFNDARFRPSKDCAHLALGGLARDDALELAAAVLNDNGIDRAAIRRQELVDLIERLGGHPLSLNLALPHLRDHTPAELTARFEALLPGFTEGAAKERNESLAVSLEFSLRRLGDATRAALPDLAVFQGGAMESVLLAITQIDPELWKAARAELEQSALITAEAISNVNSPFLRFHPTLAPYLAGRLPAERRATLEQRYWNEYYRTANLLYELDTQHPHEARAIVVRELPNLQRALDLAIAARANDEAVDFVTRIARFLNNFGRWRERDLMLAKVERLRFDGVAGLTRAEYLQLSGRGEALWQTGHAAQAEALFRDLLGRLEAGAAYDTAYDHALTLFQLGRCLAAQGQPVQAIEWHQRALNSFERLSEANNNAKAMCGKVYTALGDSLAALGQFDEAQRAYEDSLEIVRQVDDQRAVGVALGQLGTLALKRGDLAEAQRRFTEALKTFQNLGEPQMESVVWHQLGRVAEEGRDWERAERCYREAVRIREQIHDLPMLATDFNQLARVAEGAGRLDDAERWFLRAIALGEQLRNYAELGKWLNNLANLYLEQKRLDDAERYARRAMAIKETLDPSAELWATYRILTRIATAQGRAEEAAQWRRQEQDSYAAYAGSAHAMQPYQNLIAAVVRATQRDTEAQGFVKGEYSKMQAGGEEWQQTANAIRSIIAGERDIEVLRESLFSTGFVIVHTILARLSGAAPAIPEPTATPQPADASAAIAGIRQQWAPIVEAIVAACQGDAEAGAQVARLLDQLAQQDDWRALAAVLRRILAGERDADALLVGLDATDALIAGDVLRGLGVEVGM